MLVRHIMCTEIFSLPAETTLLTALRTLKSRRIRRAPLLDENGGLVGFITERDLLRLTPATVEEYDSVAGQIACQRTVADIATKKITCAHPDDHIEDLAKIFLAKKIGGVPVTDQGKVVGMITESDIFRAVIGAAHLSDATRITVQCSLSPKVEPVLHVVEALDLELVGLTEYPGPDGREVLVIRVKGDDEEELGPALMRAGWVLLDRRDGKKASAKRRAAG